MVADLGILVAADQAPTHTLPNSTSTQQSRGAEAEHKHKHADVGGRSSSGSEPADDTAVGQQAGSSADPGALLRREWRERGLPLNCLVACVARTAVVLSLLNGKNRIAR